MRRNFGLTLVLAVVIVGTTGGKADAQIVTFSASGYVANPHRAKPNGDVSWPAPTGGGTWDLRIKHDYGYITGGTFAADTNIHIGGVHWSKQVNAAGSDTWAVGGFDNLTVPFPTPTNMYIRARLQRHTGMGNYAELAVAYIKIP